MIGAVRPRGASGRLFLTVLAVAAATLLAATLLGARALATEAEPKAVTALLASCIPFLLIVGFTLFFERSQDRRTLRRATAIILIAAAAMRIVLLVGPPNSTDIYRYVWDGRVQAAGINPYRYIPADPALAALRDRAIYPHINRASYAPTIYPPAAQMLFRLVALVGGGVTTMKAAMVLFEAAGTAALLALLRRHGLPPTRVLLYAWHPLALFEFAGSGHIDAAAIALTLLALLVADRGKPAGAGALLAIATAVKFFPLVIAPALYRRWDWRAPAAAGVTLLALYLPYLSVGWGVFGFLGGYAHEEAIDAGTGFFLLGWLDQQIDLPDWARPAYLAVALVVLAALALAAVLRRAPARVSPGWAMALLAAFTLFMSPHLPWYFTWTIPLLCFRPSPAVLYLSCAAGLLYWQAHDPANPIYSILLYLPFLGILLAELAVRGVFRLKENERHVTVAA